MRYLERRRIVLLGVIAAGAASCVTPVEAAACPHAGQVAGSSTVDQVREGLHCLVNAQRAAHGLAPVRPSAELRAAAQRHGADMVARRYVGHTSPTGGTLEKRVRRTGYLAGARRWELGEDIGWAPTSGATPVGLMRAWMGSPPHRAVLLAGEFRDVGIGIALGVPVVKVTGGATFVLNFGSTR